MLSLLFLIFVILSQNKMKITVIIKTIQKERNKKYVSKRI